ncbi:MAG: zf-HC2 domain-containing protein [Treponema sp.]|nr:zf-HC2 domain-containing protein [Treponema sp.]
MCPDRQIASLYFDGELPSPWKEKMETHLSGCPECRNVLASYRGLGGVLEGPRGEAVGIAQDRVWKKITAPELITGGAGASSGKKPLSRRQRAAKRVWNQRVTLPLPAAAAVLAFVVFFAAFGIRGAGQVMPPQHPSAAIPPLHIGFDDYAVIPIHDINDVLRHIPIQDNMDFMVIRLPEHRRFSRTEQPVLINAADYSMARRDFRR